MDQSERKALGDLYAPNGQLYTDRPRDRSALVDGQKQAPVEGLPPLPKGMAANFKG
jgi:hypothetical protein